MEYNRLTKWINGVPAIRTYTGSYTTPFDADVYDAIKRLAELEDKIEQGTLKEIPENAVVLTKEEYEKHKGFSREEVDEISETAIKNSRKETVKDLLIDFNEWINEHYDAKYDTYCVCIPVNKVSEFFNEKVKEYGIEVE